MSTPDEPASTTAEETDAAIRVGPRQREQLIPPAVDEYTALERLLYLQLYYSDEYLYVDELTALLGVSYTRTRKAIGRLEDCGVIERRPAMANGGLVSGIPGETGE